MSLPKKDVRAKVKDPVHAALRVMAELAGITIDRYVEKLITRHVVREAQAAIVRADEFRRAGIDGTFRDTGMDSGLMEPESDS